VAEERAPSDEELAEALGRVGVEDVLLNALSATASLGFHRLTADARDLPQARFAIEALRALEPVLREGGVDDAVVRDLEQARANLQLGYASAVAEATTPEKEPAAERGGPEEPPAPGGDRSDETPDAGEEPSL
jgi:hypothetical protein